MELSHQFTLFLQIAHQINNLDLTPGLYGSLGLYLRIEKGLPVQDIDFLIDDIVFTTQWPTITKIMAQYGFIQDPDHEHEFMTSNNAVSFYGFTELQQLTGIKLDDIPINTSGEVKYCLPTLEQFLKIYQSGLKNKWRKAKKEKEDLKKIALLMQKNKLLINTNLNQ